MALISVPVSLGELLDKITILAIKAERIEDAAKRANVVRELELLEATWARAGLPLERLGDARERLMAVNQRLWEIEDQIRDCEAAGDFGPRFVELARAVYLTNDERAAIKKQVNLALGSELVEEKSYRDYRRPSA